MGSFEEFLKSKLLKQYTKEQTEEIINGLKEKKKTTFRVNTLKSNNEEIEQELEKENISFKKSKISDIAYIIEAEYDSTLRKMDIYTEGKIYIQSLSSMLPPIILNPLPEKDILDMAAAPGGKTTQLAAISGNKAHITAYEKNKIRAEKLKYNLEKQGASCVYTMVEDARNIDDFFSFDQILLDSPCSGSGTLNLLDENTEKYFTEKLIINSVKAQNALIKKAINVLKVGGEMVYSTCSILACENEEVVDNALKTGRVELVPVEKELIKDIPLLPSKFQETMVVAPNELYEGFFVAKFKKIK